MTAYTRLILCLFLLAGHGLLAQKRPAAAQPTPRPAAPAAPRPLELGLIAKVTPGTVLLRWLPISYAVWSQGIDGGYVLDRTDAQGTKTRLTPTPLLPNVEPLAAYNDTTKRQDMTLVSVALYKDGVKDKMPASQLKQSHEFFMMSSLLNYASSKQAGVGLEDATTTAGQAYTYTVSLAANPAISASVAVNTGELTRYGAINNLAGKALKQTLDLSWDEQTYRLDYPFYLIERSEDGVNFERINPNPYMNGSSETTSIIGFREQMPKQDTLLYYRVRGVDYFTQPSEPSNVVRVMAIPALPLPTDLAGEMTQDKRLTMRWQFPAELTKYITKVQLSQSVLIDQYYETATDSLPASAREAQFTARSRAVYVRVHYTDVQGQEGVSAPRLVQLVDTLPPAAPTQVAGRISKDGLLTLDWADSPEEDFMGYYVFAANDSLGTPTRITDTYLTKSQFQDSVAVKNVANKKMYYYVLAIDTRYNHSALSRVAVVLRPDLVPPTKPNFVDYEVVEKRVTLTWVNPTDDDIRRTTLRRRPANATTWTTLRTFDRANTPTTFTDTTIAPRTIYAYDLVVEDATGNEAQAYQPLTLRSADELIRIRFSEVRATYDADKQQVVLSWKADRLDAIDSFIVQREYPGEELSTWQVVDAPESICVDDQLHKDAKHTYVIQAKLKEGYVSPTSAKADVQL